MNELKEQNGMLVWAVKALFSLIAAVGLVAFGAQVLQPEVSVEPIVLEPPTVEVQVLPSDPVIEVIVESVAPVIEFAPNILLPEAAAVEPDVFAYSYQTDNYAAQGGSSWIVGGDVQVISGGELSATTGSTVNFSGSAVDIGDTVGNFIVTGARPSATGNVSFLTVEGNATGQVANSKVRALEISLERPAGQEIDVGDMADFGLFIRVESEAVTTTAGTVLRGVDVEAKVDNPSGTVTNLNGGTFTAKSDSGAGAVANMTALAANAHTGTQANAATAMLLAGDFRIARFSSTEPTEEYIIHLRSGSEAGTGADAAIYIESDFSGQTDDFNYGIDMSSADIDNGDIRFQNGTVLEETTDTILTFSEFLGGEEQTAEVVTGGSTIVPTGTWQPISSTGAVTCSTSTCITAGTKDGQLLILQNVNASDTITIDGTGGGVECKSDVVLGARDTLGLLWNGAEWNCLFNYDNS